MPSSPELNPINPQNALAEKEEARPDVFEGGQADTDPRQVIDLLSIQYDKSKEFILAEKAKIEAAIAADKTQAYSEKMGARYNEINYKILPELDAKIAEIHALAESQDAAAWEAKIAEIKKQLETQTAFNSQQEKNWEDAEWEAREFAERRAQADAREAIEKAAKAA